MNNSSPIVPFTVFESVFDNQVLKRYELPWQDFVELIIDDHMVVSAKEDAYLISPYKFKTEGVLNEDGTVKRCAENVEYASMLFLDFDGGLPINMAKAKFHKVEHIGYTSFSHRTPKKQGLDCFRLIILLAEPIPMEELRARKQSILSWIGTSDDSTLDLSRSFYIPSCAQDMKGLAVRWHNQGSFIANQWIVKAAPLDWRQFEPQPEPVFELTTREPMSDRLRQKLLDRLHATPIYHEPVWTKVCWAMQSDGFSFEDFCYVTIGGMMREKSRADCKKKWDFAVSHNKQINAGYLWNIVKGIHRGK